MKNKKVFLWLGCGILAVMIIVGAVFFAGGRNKTIKPEELKRATTARQLLLDSIGTRTTAVTWRVPDYLIGRYIDDDCKLQIRLYESTKEQETIIKEILGEYADVAEFSYVPITWNDLGHRAWDIERILRQQGYSIDDVIVENGTGNIRVFIKEKNEILSAAAWVKEQTEYPFDDVGIDIVFKSDIETYLISERCAEALTAYLREIGGYEAYKDYYCGAYIGLDSMVHVVLNESISKSEKAGFQSCLKEYSEVVVYEYGGYPAAEAQAYASDLMQALIDLGLGAYSASVDPITTLPAISIIREDLPLAQALLGKGKPYPFGNEKFTVIFEIGVTNHILD